MHFRTKAIIFGILVLSFSGRAQVPEKFAPVLSSSTMSSFSYDGESLTNFNLSSIDADWSDDGRRGFCGQLSYDVVVKHLMGLNVGYRIAPWMIVRIGEQKMMFFNEITSSPRTLEVNGYSMGMSYLGAYTKDLSGLSTRSRDWGITVAGNLFPSEGSFYRATYNFGIFQGNGYKLRDSDNAKNATFLLTFSPLKSLKISAGGMLGKYSATGDDGTGMLLDRNRLSAGVWFSDGKYILKGEAVYGKTGLQESRGLFVLGALWFREDMAIALRGDSFLADCSERASRTEKAEVCYTHKLNDILRYRIQYTWTGYGSGIDSSNALALSVSVKFTSKNLFK